MGWFQIPTEKESLLLKWLQTWENLTLFVRTFKFQLTEPYIFCWDIQTPTEKTVQYRNDFKDDRTLHPLLGHSSSNWKGQFSIEMTLWMTELYIFWREIQIPTKKDSLWLQRWEKLTFFVGIFQFRTEEDQFSIEMIPKMTVPYILCGDIQIPTEKDSSVLKWFQIWKNLTSFVGRFKFQLKKTVQYWNDYKDDRILHSFWGHSDSDWKNSSVSKWFQRSQNFTSSILTFKFQMKKKTV